MVTQNSTTNGFNHHRTSPSTIHSMCEHLQHPHPPHQLHSRLYLHGGPTPSSNNTSPLAIAAAHQTTHPRRQRIRRYVEFRRHVLCPSTVDLPRRNEHRPQRLAGVDELHRAVVVGEFVAVGVGDGEQLEECEVHSAVGDGEVWELERVDGDGGGFWFKQEEVNDDGSGDEQEQE